MSIILQRLSYKRIGEAANQFLSNYHPRLSLPIPIEEIAEQKLNLRIHEQMNLKKDYDVDGFLISDLTTIFIDFNLYMNFENRTRFTIAHEIGHFILHSELFKNLNINSVEDLNIFAANLTDEEHGWLEYQAYTFASHVLVPTQLLTNELGKRLGRIPSLEAPEILATVIEDLLDIFQVSGDVLARRLVKEGIIKPNS